MQKKYLTQGIYLSFALLLGSVLLDLFRWGETAFWVTGFALIVGFLFAPLSAKPQWPALILCFLSWTVRREDPATPTLLSMALLLLGFASTSFAGCQSWL